MLAIIVLVRCITAAPIISYAGWLSHENDYYNTARTIVQQGRLPTPADFPGQPGVQLQAQQPPLFYALVVPIVALLDSDAPVPPPEPPPTVCFGWDATHPSSSSAPALSDSHHYTTSLPNPAAARAVLRGLNLVMFGLALVLMYGAARRLLPGNPYAAVCAAALLAFEPNTIIFTTLISNDSLLLLIASAYVYVAARLLTEARARMLPWAAIGVLTLLAVLTRLNGWSLLLVTIVLVLTTVASSEWVHISAHTRRWLLAGVGLFAASFAALMVINLFTVGSLFGRYNELEEVLLAGASVLFSDASFFTVVTAIMRDTGVNSYLSAVSFIGHSRVIAAFGWASLALVGLGLVFGTALTWRHNRRAAIVLMAVIFSAVLLVLTRHAAALGLSTDYSTTLIFAPLRYYVTALPALALLIGTAMAAIRPLALLGLIVIGCWIVIRLADPNFHTVQPQMPPLSAPDAAFTSADPAQDGTHSAFPRVLTQSWAIEDSSGLLDLRLVAAVDQPLPKDYVPRVELTTPDGTTRVCQFPPANGRYPTTLWQVGERIETHVTIPNCPFALPAGTRVSLRWVSTGDQSQAFPIGTLSETWLASSTCPSIIGMFDDALIVTRYTTPLSARLGDLYLPAVNWYLLNPTRAQFRTFILKHESGVEYACEGQPRLDTYPFANWVPGETIYFDECALRIPPDAPTGTYQVLLSLSGSQVGALPVTDADGQTVPGFRLLLTPITVLP
jgi:hypothetical protein